MVNIAEETNEESRLIIDIFKVMSNVEKIDDILDNILEPLNDYTDTLDDLIAPIRQMKKVFNVAKKIKVKNYAKEYAKTVNAGKQLEREQVLKLEEYMKNDKNRGFMAEVIDCAINAKSNKCASVLGYYSGKILSELINLEYKDTISINALREMNDYELASFIKIYKKCSTIRIEEGSRYFFIDVSEFREESEYINIQFSKLKKLQVFSEDTHTRLDGGGNFIKGCLNQVSDYLYNIIIDSNIIII